MPQIDHSLMQQGGLGAAGEEPLLPIERKRERRTKTPAAAHDARETEKLNAAIETFKPYESFTAEDLPSPELLTPPPPRNADVGKFELVAMGIKLTDALRTFSA